MPGIARLWRAIKDVVKFPFYVAYGQRLGRKSRGWRKPQHVGFIMDGNRRFARYAGYANIGRGHSEGADKLHEVLRWCNDLDIPVVTAWAFSVDNFSRSPEELEELFDLFERKLREVATNKSIHRNRIRICFLGNRRLLPLRVQYAIEDAERATAMYDSLTLNIALAYGGREEVTDAFRRYFADEVARGVTPADVATNLDPAAIDRYLYTAGQPDPDLIIRTSGELRLSGFLMWQSVYSEYYFCDTLWPAFRKIDFLRALRSYDLRQRRYGR